uniref:Uncharacterized protein n=1 Tax=Plectus sambesii TaxID=2011161 RepID=A0A914VHQ2_9BILA
MIALKQQRNSGKKREQKSGAIDQQVEHTEHCWWTEGGQRGAMSGGGNGRSNGTMVACAFTATAIEEERRIGQRRRPSSKENHLMAAHKRRIKAIST